MSAHSQPVSHYLVLDVFRFVAALGVMLAHYGLVIVLRTGGSIPDFIDRFHLLVDFFFILSGFVIALHYDGRIASAHDYADYMRRRLARIYPLHLLTLLLTVLIFALGVSVGMPVRDPARFDFSALPSHFMLTHAFSLTRALTFNVPSWSLSAEFLVYLLFPLLALIARRGIVTVSLFVVIYVSGLIALRDWLGLGSWTRGDFDLGALRAVPSFLAGITIARLVKGREGMALPWPLVIVFAAQCGILLFFPVREELVILAFALLVFLTARTEQENPVPQRLRRLFHELGTMSFGIYLWHIVIGTLVVTGGARLLGETRGSYIFLSCVAALVSMAVAWLGYRWFERPAQRLLQGRRTGVAQNI